jgi:signal peptidase I
MRLPKVISFTVWVILLTAYLTGHKIMLVEGTSMLPTIPPFSLILIQPLKVAGEVKVGDVVLIRKVFISEGRLSEEEWVKRLRVVSPYSGGVCLVQGDNREVSWDTWLDCDDIKGKVYALTIGWVQTLIVLLLLVEIALWAIDCSIIGSLVSWAKRAVKYCQQILNKEGDKT